MYSKITFILEEAYSARINNLKKSIELGEKALSLAKELGFSDLQAKACSHLSLFNMINGNNDLCIEYANTSIDMYTSLNDDKGVADAKYAISGVMYKTNNYHLGLVYLIDALNVYKKYSDYHNISRCEKTLGTIYEYFEDNEKAVESYENAIAAAKKIKDIKLESNALNNLSSVYIKKGDVAKADNLIETSLKMKIKADDVRGLAFAIYGKAKVLAANKKFKEAEKLYVQSIEIHRKMGEKMGLSMAYHKLSKLYFETNENELAKRTLEVALELIDLHNISLIRFKCYYLLYTIYKTENDNEKSLKYLELYLKEKESVVNTETLKVVDKYDILVKMKTMEREAELQRERAEIIERNNRAEEAARVRQEFLSTMSHEIRTPLNAITTIINMLSEEQNIKDNPLLEPLKFSSNHLMMIINDILDFTKLDLGKVELDFTDNNLTELLNKIYQTYYPSAEEKGIELICEIDDNFSEYYKIDNTKFIQVIGNLVNNAIKFTDLGSVRIKSEIIKSTNLTDEILFEVTDTGEGIESHKLDQIFDSFSQIKNIRTRKAGGTGLGLAIVKNLVQLFGGEIRVESKYGKGSKFSFSIELEKSNPNISKVTNEENIDFANKKVLLAEDNMINAMIAKKLLSKWGMEVEHVCNGKEAVLASGRKVYDLILMDIHMPEMDGFEATKYIRTSNNLNRDTPVFSLTADVSAKDNYDYQGLFSGFLLKPLEVDKLYQVLSSYV
ncbi:MAG TPA: ATP-binding protein [Flavobacterium lutivivi]|nr:ATP-binding protein [Flavobacterium lutivivi]